MRCFFYKLIQNNTGISSKNFFLVVITIIGCILLLMPAIIIPVELFTTGLTTDLTGIASYIGAVAGIFAAAGVTKAWSEKYEDNHNEFINHSDNE
jgi:hypothetical protein